MPICNICGGADFKDFNNRERVMCAKCGSVERHRAMRWLFDTRYPMDFSGKKVLQLAPEACTYSWLQAAGAFIIPADVNPRLYAHAKCFRLQFPDDFSILPADNFDFIIHNHIMEHIPGDYRAHLIQFLRILAPGGSMVFTMPYFEGLAVSEQGGEFLASDSERLARFGQGDHVRKIGRDIFEAMACLRCSFEAVKLPQKEREELRAPDIVFVMTKDSA